MLVSGESLQNQGVNDLGASVGIGGLVMGTSLLVVCAVALTTISSQLDTSIEVIESTEQKAPEFDLVAIDYSSRAILSVVITDAGTGYDNGTISATTGSFSATFTVNSTGSIIDIDIVDRGNYSSSPTLVVDTPNPGVNASFTISSGNYIEFELLNSGSEVMELNNTWIFLNGTEPYNLGSLYTPSISSWNWYQGETIQVQMTPVSSAWYDRISFGTMGYNLAANI